MKKIDKNSPVVNGVRTGMEMVSYLGADIAVESVLIPFVATVWKNNPIRLLGYVGSIALAWGAGAFAARTTEDMIDIYIETHNELVDKKNPKPEFELVQEIPADKITTGKISKEQLYPENPAIVDAVANSKIFEFKHEEDAKTLIASINMTHGPATILDFAKARNYAEPSWGNEYFDKIDIPEAKIYGWKSFEGVEIEQINDDLFFVDLLNYEILPEKVNYYKDSDMNHMIPKED